MSAYLLDTCTFLWLTLEPQKLSPHAREICEHTESSLLLSAVSVWEIVFKNHIGKLPLAIAPPDYIRIYRAHHLIDPLPFSEEAALRQWTLPLKHKDPFDRMLICQAIEADVPIITPDRYIREYGVKTVW